MASPSLQVFVEEPARVGRSASNKNSSNDIIAERGGEMTRVNKSLANSFLSSDAKSCITRRHNRCIGRTGRHKERGRTRE